MCVTVWFELLYWKRFLFGVVGVDLDNRGGVLEAVGRRWAPILDKSPSDDDDDINGGPVGNVDGTWFPNSSAFNRSEYV